MAVSQPPAPGPRAEIEIPEAAPGALPEIDAARLWDRHMALAKIGARPGGGVHRLALDADDIAAHRLLADWALARGFGVSLDAVGNMFLRRPATAAGADPEARPAVAGSHCDSQPTGGRFDGVFGVLAALEAMETAEDRGLATLRPMECVVWMNEEGARFRPGCMGSEVYAGGMGLNAALAKLGDDGAVLGDCVADLRRALPEAGERALGAPFHALLEAHIEQGPLLEAGGEVIGVVDRVQGHRRLAISVIGREDHSGGAPLSLRKDAFVDAIEVCRGLAELCRDPSDVLRFTFGRFTVSPNAVSVVPGRVDMILDLRHPSQDELIRLGALVKAEAPGLARLCAVEVEDVSWHAPVAFSETVQAALGRAADRRGFARRAIDSGGGHDARWFPGKWPTGMLFIPCEAGISHNPAENVDPAHAAAGAQVLADVFFELAMS